MAKEKQPWDRLPDESPMWHRRFEQYRMMGPEARSVVSVYNQFRAQKGKAEAKQQAGSWSAACIRFRWRERCEAWDDAEIERLRERRDKEADKLFANIEMALQAAYVKLAQRVRDLNPSSVPAGSVVPQLIAIVNKLQELYGRKSPAQMEIGGIGGGAVVVDVEQRRKVLERASEIQQEIEELMRQTMAAPLAAGAVAQDGDSDDGDEDGEA